MKTKFFWLRLLLSGSLISFLFYTIDAQETVDIITQSNPWYLLIAFLIALGDRVLMAYKWTILLKAKGIRIPLLNVTGTYLTSTFFGLFLPATVGGDALRAYALSKNGYRASDIVSSIIVERALGFIALFIFVLVSIGLSIFVFGQDFFAGIWNLFWLFSVVLVISSILIYISLNDRVLRWGASFFQSWNLNASNHKLIRKLKEVHESYQSYQDKVIHLGVFLGLSFVESLFPLLWTYFLSLAFDINVPVLYFFILIPIVLVLVRLPISLDGFGIQEGAFVYFLHLIGVTNSEALLLGVASHILAILSVLPGGISYSFSGLGFRDDKNLSGREEITKAPVDV